MDGDRLEEAELVRGRVSISIEGGGAEVRLARPDKLNALDLSMPVSATEIDDEADRARLWARADRVFPALARYRRSAKTSARRTPILGLTPRPAAEADAGDLTGMFVFDGECGFCRRWISWLRHHLLPSVVFVPYQQVEDLGAYGLALGDVRSASYWIDAHGQAHRGAASFAHVLRRADLPWSWLGALLRVPLVSAVADRVYGLIARNRHRLPAPRER